MNGLDARAPPSHPLSVTELHILVLGLLQVVVVVGEWSWLGAIHCTPTTCICHNKLHLVAPTTTILFLFLTDTDSGLHIQYTCLFSTWNRISPVRGFCKVSISLLYSRSAAFLRVLHFIEAVVGWMVEWSVNQARPCLVTFWNNCTNSAIVCSIALNFIWATKNHRWQYSY